MQVIKFDEAIPQRIFRKLKYPKLIILLLTFILAYYLFQRAQTIPFSDYIIPLGIPGAFIAGMFFSYGFTAAPATALLLVLGQQETILITAIIAPLGAMTSDFLIFKFIKTSFKDEINRLSKLKIFKLIKKKTPSKVKKYVLPIIEGFIIASPLPDEIGISLLAIATTISTRQLLLLSFIFNTIGILLILLIGKAI